MLPKADNPTWSISLDTKFLHLDKSKCFKFGSSAANSDFTFFQLDSFIFRFSQIDKIKNIDLFMIQKMTYYIKPITRNYQYCYLFYYFYILHSDKDPDDILLYKGEEQIKTLVPQFIIFKRIKKKRTKKILLFFFFVLVLIFQKNSQCSKN